MEWLTDWLRQIIAVILLAGIIDLLVPSSSYQRYVRLVIGLLILLTLLSPVLRLLQGDFETRLTDTLHGWGKDKSTAASGMPGLEQIREQANDLQKQRLTQASSLAGSQLASAMQAELEQKTGLSIAEISVKLESGGKAGEANRIAKVDVVLTGLDQGESDDEGIPGSDPVQPVVVHIGIPDIEASQGEGQQDKTAMVNTERSGTKHQLQAEDGRYKQVALILSQSFQVEPKAINVFAPASG